MTTILKAIVKSGLTMRTMNIIRCTALHPTVLTATARTRLTITFESLLQKTAATIFNTPITVKSKPYLLLVLADIHRTIARMPPSM